MSDMTPVQVTTLGVAAYGLFLCAAWPFVRAHAGVPLLLIFLLALSPWSFLVLFAYVALIRLQIMAAATWYLPRTAVVVEESNAA